VQQLAYLTIKPNQSLMKTKTMLFLMLGFLLAVACQKDKEPDYPPELSSVITAVTASLDSLSNSISAEVTLFAQTGIDTAIMRTKLLELFNGSSFATEMVFTTPLGILQIAEPAAFYAYQGTDISMQSHVIKAFQTKQPVLSDAFMVVEGYQAVVEIHPIAQNSQILGAISALYAPEFLLGRIIEPYVQGKSFEIWVMEKSGRVLFDQDTTEIGLNVLTDPAYANFPELIAACKLMAAEASGETTYSYFQAGTSTIVKKKTYWKTIVVHGNEWKVIWVKPE